MGLYGGIRERSAENERIKQARTRPAPVTVRLQCPHCGGDHRAEDHDLTNENRQALARMSQDSLRHLRGQVVDELVSAVKGGAGAEHLRGVGIVLRAIDRRLDA